MRLLIRLFAFMDRQIQSQCNGSHYAGKAHTETCFHSFKSTVFVSMGLSLFIVTDLSQNSAEKEPRADRKASSKKNKTRSKQAAAKENHHQLQQQQQQR